MRFGENVKPLSVALPSTCPPSARIRPVEDEQEGDGRGRFETGRFGRGRPRDLQGNEIMRARERVELEAVADERGTKGEQARERENQIDVEHNAHGSAAF